MMAYHQSNLGMTAHPFADNTGYVPQDGDKWEHFNYAGRGGPSRGEWDGWVQDAKAFTERAEEAIRKRVKP